MNDLSLRHLPAGIPLASVRFENSFVEALPGDSELRNVPRPVRNACYTPVTPTPVAAPKLLAWSESAGRLLGLARPDSPKGIEAEVLGGNRVLEGMRPYAARYGGHQFGHWAGQLGDGRAITLAEAVAPDGSRQELQLKGAGRTPYSRTADGRAVLRSSLREFLCSEAMHHLGVPTTRALSLVGTGEAVVRDMFYDGRPEAEPGAVVCRVAPSFLRFGNFQIHAAHEEHALLARLSDWVMRAHYPALTTVVDWYAELCRRTALLVVDWMRLGFVHGVMNTDNMSILGLTIDYGPYGWLEGYDPAWTPNTTDAQGRRYAYGNQPHIAQWNLARLGEALLPLVSHEAAPIKEALGVYATTYNEAWPRAVAAKLGLASIDLDSDDTFVATLFERLQDVETDFTLFFRNLAGVPLEATDDAALLAPLAPAFYAEPGAEARAAMAAWLREYARRARQEDPRWRLGTMNAANPRFVPRNWLAQQAIDALAAGDASMLERLMRVLERPYDEQPGAEDLSARRPEWARHKAGCSALSCSS